ncbi:MAG: amidohydrolase family protein [Treponema sp.]|nr:amidohydrolase family protein [Treponema sp.]
MNKTCFYNARLVDANTDASGILLVAEGKIAAILLGEFSAESAKTLAESFFSDTAASISFIDCKGMILQPAFIDLHAHFRYPGQGQKEELSTALAAAAAGGFGTLVLMPNTIPAISSKELVEQVCNDAHALGIADVIQSITLTKDYSGNDTSHLQQLSTFADGTPPSAGQVAMATEDGKDVESAATMLEAMKICGQKNITVACHSEDMTLAAAARPFRKVATDIFAIHAPQPQEALGAIPDATDSSNAEINKALVSLEEANRLLSLAEDLATERNINLAHQAGCHIHLSHVSTAGAMDAIRAAKAKGYRVSCEVTPHHLGLSVAEKDPSLRHIVNPPLRSEQDRQAMIQALLDGTADCISTDHAPHTAQDKANGAPGFSGLETAYGVCNSVLVQGIQGAASGKTLSYSQLSQLMAANPARLLKLHQGAEPRGLLQTGFVADLTLCNPTAQWTVCGQNFASKGKYTPLEGKSLTGKVLATYHRGREVFKSE